MKNLKILGAIALVLVMAGCASTAYVEKDDSIDFSSYDSYAWVDKKPGDNSMTSRNIRNAVNQELKRSGWREDESRPDVLISYDVLVERATRRESNPVYSRPYSRTYYNPYTRRWMTIHYPSQFLGYERSEVPVKEGTITVTIIDARTDNTIWQGWTTDVVKSRNLTSKEIQNSVKSIFRKFDIAKK